MVPKRAALLAQQDPYSSTLLPPGALAKEIFFTLVSSLNIRLYLVLSQHSIIFFKKKTTQESFSQLKHEWFIAKP